MENSELCYAVEKILSQRDRDGEVEYLVQRRNRGVARSTWELADDLPDLDRLLKEFEMRRKPPGNKRKQRARKNDSHLAREEPQRPKNRRRSRRQLDEMLSPLKRLESENARQGSRLCELGCSKPKKAKTVCKSICPSVIPEEIADIESSSGEIAADEHEDGSGGNAKKIYRHFDVEGNIFFQLKSATDMSLTSDLVSLQEMAHSSTLMIMQYMHELKTTKV